MSLTFLKKISNDVLNYILLLFVFDTAIVFVLEQFFQHSFAFIPYYRVLIIAFTFVYFLARLFNKVTLKIKISNEVLIVICWLLFTILELLFGIFKGNPIIYIIADFIYVTFGVYLFLLISIGKNYLLKIDVLKSFSVKLIAFTIIGLILNVTISEIFFIIIISLGYIFLAEKKYKYSLPIFIVFFIKVSNSNRALLICFLTIFLLFFLKKIIVYFHKVDRIIISSFFVLLLMVFHEEFVLFIIELIPEGSPIYYRLEQLSEIISKGIDYNNPTHTSIAQRLVEAKVVISLWLNNIWSFIFGCGLGGVIDGGVFVDKSVTNTALLGGKSIHNIHLLPFAFIHKYGLLGVTIFILLIVEVYNSFKKIINSKNSVFVFWDVIFVIIFVYSLPAASFLWATPIFWIALAMKKLNKTNSEYS